ncbi:MAG: PilN domain-containing protein [Chloroflexi bacterium]|nr:PilN domain-containing protein [Chloroflexota bacterium]
MLDLAFARRKQPGGGQTASLAPRLPRVLITLGALLLFVPLLVLMGLLQRDLGALDKGLEAVAKTATVAALPDSQVLALQTSVAQARASLGEVEQIDKLLSDHVPWNDVMTLIAQYDRSRLALDSFVQEGALLTLKGRAIDEAAVMIYVRRLEMSKLFQQVTVRSLKVLNEPFEPSAESLAPMLSVMPKWTPLARRTTEARDPYEVDDVQPVNLAVGTPQERTFFPYYDIDMVTFTAKAGRSYRIATQNLGPEVDTVLTVQLGDRVYMNDDRAPGTLESEVLLRHSGDQDQPAVVIVSNRGAYGQDQTYLLTVNLLEAEPTPSVVPGPLSLLAGATPAPGGIGSPTPSPTTKPAEPLSADGSRGDSGAKVLLRERLGGDGGVSAWPQSGMRAATPSPTPQEQNLVRSVEFIIALTLSEAS